MLSSNETCSFLFVLKAETLDDLYEWKTALENALAQAPSTASVMGQNGIFNNDQAETPNGSIEQCMLLLYHIYIVVIFAIVHRFNFCCCS